MSYFKKQPPGETSHKRILSQSFYRTPSSNEYRFSTINTRVTPDPKANKSFVGEHCATEFNVKSNNALKMDFNDTSFVNTSNISNNMHTLKKTHPLQSTIDFKSVKQKPSQTVVKQQQGDLRKFHDILEEKNDQVQEWMSRYISLEQKLNNDLQQYKEEVYYQLQIQFRKKQEELNIMRINIKNEKSILQEELNSAIQQIQLLEAENRGLQQQIKTHQAFTTTKFYRETDSSSGKKEQSRQRQNDDHQLEQANTRIKELQIQIEYMKHQNEHQGDDSQLKHQLQHERVQHQEFLANIKQEVHDLKEKEKHYHHRTIELEEALRKRQETIDQLKRNNEEEYDELLQGFEQRKAKDMQTICKLMQDKKDLNNELEAKQTTISSLQNQLSLYQNEIQQMKDMFQRRGSEDDHSDKLQEVKRRFEEQFTAMQAYYDKSKKDNEEDIDRLKQQHTQQVKTLKGQKDNLMKQIEQLESQRLINEERLINELSQLKIAKRDITDECLNYKQQNTELLIQLNERENQHVIENPNGIEDQG